MQCTLEEGSIQSDPSEFMGNSVLLRLAVRLAFTANSRPNQTDTLLNALPNPRRVCEPIFVRCEADV